MPRETSKCREWEKERRNRLNEAFTTLCKLLPCYDPAVNISKIDVLKNATTHIEELQAKIKALISENNEDSAKKVKSDEYKRLQDRIRRLLGKNEQLCALLREAKISIPPGCVFVKKFRNPSFWSNRILPEQAKVLQKKEAEKENDSSVKKQSKFTNKKQNKVGGQNSAPKHRKAILNRSDSRKLRPVKRKKVKPLTPSKCVIVLSQPSINQSCYVITNAPSNNILGGTSTVITNSGFVTNPLVSSKATKTVSSMPTLGPGTLILANGTIMPVVPQQTVLPLAPQIITRPPIIFVPKNTASVPGSTSSTSKMVTSGTKTLARIRPKYCSTKTTQVNKVPIPALTSRYSNAEVVLKKSEPKVVKGKKSAIKESDKKEEVPETGEKRKVPSPEVASEAKKAKIIEEKIINPKESETEQEKEVVIETETTADKQTEDEKCEDKAREETPPKTSEADTKKPEEPIELNINHSELSNDLFASLQVPPGCQNPESTSPTAAFLLAFPLVSTLTGGVKVAEVTEEDNTDSQRETPTLLQIGTMDSTKPTQSESLTPSLLNLDNFSFLSSKEIGGFYNSFEGNMVTTASAVASTGSAVSKESSKDEQQQSYQQPQQTNQKVQLQQQPTQPQQQPQQLLKQPPKPPQQPQQPSQQTQQPPQQPQQPSQQTQQPPQPQQPLQQQQQSLQQPRQSLQQLQQQPLQQSQQSHEQQKKSLIQPQQPIQQQQKPLSQQQRSLPPQPQPLPQQQQPQPLSQQQQSLPRQQQQPLKHQKPSLQQPQQPIQQQQKPLQQQKQSLQQQPQVLQQQPLITQQLPLQHQQSQQLHQQQPQQSHQQQQQQSQQSHQQQQSQQPHQQKSQSSHQPQSQQPHQQQQHQQSHQQTQPQQAQQSQSLQQTQHLQEKNQLVPCFDNHTFGTANAQPLNYQPKLSVGNLETKQQSICVNTYGQKNFTYETPKVSATCVYANIKTYPEPLYTNSSTYTYSNTSDTNFNQNYYKEIQKGDNRSYYSLSYENYADYRKNDSTYFPNSNYYTNTNYSKDKFNNNVNQNSKKGVQSRPPINWMTTPDNRLQTPADYVLPQFTKESDFYPINTFTNTQTTYFNTNPMYPTNTSEVTNQEPRKSLDLSLVPPVNSYQRNEVEDNQLSWSPTKIPQFLDPPHSFATTLPTLVGDLALGNSLSFNDQKDKCPKKDRRLKNYESTNQSNFLSVSQLVDHNKEVVPARTTTRRNSGNRSSGKKVPQKSSQRKENKEVYPQTNKVEGSTGKGMKQLGYSNSTTEVFCDSSQKSRSVSKNSYSAEALIGHQMQNDSTQKKQQNYNSKPISVSSFLHDNIIPYFPVDLPQDNTYMQQNQNYQTSSFTHNFQSTFQNNTYTANSFIPTTTITSTYNFMHDVTHDYSELFPPMTKDKTCAKNVNRNVREQQCPTTPKKSSKRKHSNELPGFDFPFLSMPGSINSPILPDDFHTHTGFLQPPTPQLYPCKNPFTKPNDLASGSLLPLPPVPVTRSNIQHPEISPINSGGTSLTNFNLSTIFPEINNKVTKRGEWGGTY